MMKKLLPALFILALIVLGILYYLKQSVPETAENDSWQSYVPENVASVVQINTIKLRDLMISEGFKSPKKLKSLYDDLDSMKTKINIPTKEVELLIREGLLLPDQFVAFETVVNDQSILCSVFPVKKKNTFNKIFKEREYREVSKNHFYLENKKIGVLLDGNKCILLYGLGMSESIFKRTTKNILLHKQSYTSSQINSDRPEFSLTINKGSMLHHERSPFRNFNIEIVGSHTKGSTIIDLKITNDASQPKLLLPVKNKFPDKTKKEAIASFAVNFNLEDYPLIKILNDKQLRDIDKSLKVIQGDISDVDSIWNGEVSFILKKPFVKKEKFTSYTYNDNFEKVELVQTKVDTIPDFEMIFTLGENGNERLLNKSWVQNSEFIVYPLQKVFYSSNNDIAHLSPRQSGDQNIFELKNNLDSKTNESINIQINVDELMAYYPHFFEKHERSIYQKHIEKISVIEVENMAYRLKISYDNIGQHGLISLLEFLNDYQKNVTKTNNEVLKENLP